MNVVNDLNVVRRERHKCSLDVVRAKVAKGTVKDVARRFSPHDLCGIYSFSNVKGTLVPLAAHDIHDIHGSSDVHGATIC